MDDLTIFESLMSLIPYIFLGFFFFAVVVIPMYSVVDAIRARGNSDHYTFTKNGEKIAGRNKSFFMKIFIAAALTLLCFVLFGEMVLGVLFLISVTILPVYGAVVAIRGRKNKRQYTIVKNKSGKSKGRFSKVTKMKKAMYRNMQREPISIKNYKG